MFLQLTDISFQQTTNIKSLNVNLKVSYSCTHNISQIIKGHNKKVTQIRRSHQLEYNLRIETECALHGSCRKEGLRYLCATLTPF